jgi:hypothetical protein
MIGGEGETKSTLLVAFSFQGRETGGVGFGDERTSGANLVKVNQNQRIGNCLARGRSGGVSFEIISVESEGGREDDGA